MSQSSSKLLLHWIPKGTYISCLLPSTFYPMPHRPTLPPWCLLWKYWDSFLIIFLRIKFFGNTGQGLTHGNPSSTWLRDKKSLGILQAGEHTLSKPPLSLVGFQDQSVWTPSFSYCVSIGLLFFSNGLKCGPQEKRQGDCSCPWALSLEPMYSQKGGVPLSGPVQLIWRLH